MLNLIDKLAGWWLDWRMSMAVRNSPDLKEFKKFDIHSFEAGPGGWNLTGISPAVALIADEAASMLEANNAKNYVSFDMIPRLDRGMKPIRVTVQWARGESPATKAARLEAEVERLKEKIGDLELENLNDDMNLMRGRSEW